MLFCLFSIELITYSYCTERCIFLIDFLFCILKLFRFSGCSIAVNFDLIRYVSDPHCCGIFLLILSTYYSSSDVECDSSTFVMVFGFDCFQWVVNKCLLVS